MSALPESINPFHGPIRSLVTGIGGSDMIISRVNSSELGTGIYLSSEAEDAFVIAYQLSDLPSYAVWNDGRHTQRPAEKKSAFKIFDLHLDTLARIDTSFDFLLIHVPRPALVALADSNDVPPVNWIATQSRDSKQDPVLDGLHPSVLHLLSHPDAHHRLVREHLMLTLLSHVAGGQVSEVLHPGRFAERKRRLETISARTSRWPTSHSIAPYPQVISRARSRHRPACRHLPGFSGIVSSG
jgi:hypothetical protein